MHGKFSKGRYENMKTYKEIRVPYIYKMALPFFMLSTKKKKKTIQICQIKYERVRRRRRPHPMRYYIMVHLNWNSFAALALHCIMFMRSWVTRAPALERFFISLGRSCRARISFNLCFFFSLSLLSLPLSFTLFLPLFGLRIHNLVYHSCQKWIIGCCCCRFFGIRMNQKRKLCMRKCTDGFDAIIRSNRSDRSNTLFSAYFLPSKMDAVLVVFNRICAKLLQYILFPLCFVSLHTDYRSKW